MKKNLLNNLFYSLYCFIFVRSNKINTMNVTDLTNKKGYFFDGHTILIGYIGGGESPYCKFLSGRVLYSAPFCGSYMRAWSTGYSYDNWDWRDFDFIPHTAFSGLAGYLDFIETATMEQLKAYFKIKDLMKTEDFISSKVSL